MAFSSTFLDSSNVVYQKTEKIDRIDDMEFIYILPLAEVHQQIVCPESGYSVLPEEMWSEVDLDLIFVIALIWALFLILGFNWVYFGWRDDHHFLRRIGILRNYGVSAVTRGRMDDLVRLFYLHMPDVRGSQICIGRVIWIWSLHASPDFLIVVVPG